MAVTNQDNIFNMLKKKLPIIKSVKAMLVDYFLLFVIRLMTLMFYFDFVQSIFDVIRNLILYSGSHLTHLGAAAIFREQLIRLSAGRRRRHL